MKFYVEFNGKYTGGYQVEAQDEKAAIESAKQAAMACIEHTVAAGYYTVEEVKPLPPGGVAYA